MTKVAVTPLLSYGFRPFFLGASLLATVSIALWVAIYLGQYPAPSVAFQLSPALWHAHEMLFGYSLAVITGFLLTAVRNWTSLPGVEGRALAWLFVLWCVPRVLMNVSSVGTVALAAVFDLAFIASVFIAFVAPVARSGLLRRQAGITAKLALIGLSHLGFYWALLADQPQWLLPCLYSALYLIVALCLTLARRLIPFFVKSGAGIELPVSATLDKASLVLFFAFWLSVLSLGHTALTAALSMGLVAVHAIRLWQWRTPVVLQSPLLWILYVAYAGFVLGFVLVAAASFFETPLTLAIHAFAVGGIGTLTLGMMSRVAWGHTGRPLTKPPRALASIFGLIIAAGVIRVGGPLLAPDEYVSWVACAGVLWVLAFMGFLVVYTRVLVSPRPDAQ